MKIPPVDRGLTTAFNGLFDNTIGRAQKSRQAEQLLDTQSKLEANLNDRQKADLQKAVDERGWDGITDFAKDNLGPSSANPSRSASAKPRGAVQSRLQTRMDLPSDGVFVGQPDGSVEFVPYESNSTLPGRILERSAEYLLAHHQAINGGQFDFDLQDAMSVLGSDFNLPLAALNLAKAEGAAEDGFFP